jgi:hypothetical protein
MASWNYVSVRRGAYRFPDRCAACCKSGPERSLRLRSDLGDFKRWAALGSVHEHLWVEMPFCASCATRQIRWKKIGACLLIVALVAGVSLQISLGLGYWLAASLVVVLCLPAFWLLGSRGLGIRVVWYDEQRVAFSFRSQQYAQEFGLLNGLVRVVLPGGQVTYRPKHP